MAKLKVGQVKEGEQYWFPKFDELTHRFESDLKTCCFGCWGDFAEGWAFDTMEECDILCSKLNKAIGQLKKWGKSYVNNTKHFKLLCSSPLHDDVVINFHMPKEGFGAVPSSLIQKEVDDAKLYHHHFVVDSESPSWMGGNYDAGSFDALTVRHYSRKQVDVYFCSILHRPFSEEELESYKAIYSKDLKYRLTHIFDNSVSSEVLVFK